MKKYFSINNLALLYLWIPVIIFLISWVKWLIAIPVLSDVLGDMGSGFRLAGTKEYLVIWS